ncbi:8-amino-7-oxononanoate synthase [Flavobacteriales bacterium 34_180_T64]|nr:8-amino-7-oxononanoate synthase [Flavobacteriales bacterium 34_180_T64]
MKIPKKLQTKIDQRVKEDALRQLGEHSNIVDFASNDYLGFSKSRTIFNKTHDYLVGHDCLQNGSTGSRLLSGNHPLYTTLESILCEFHNSDSALVFNSGYDANLGFFSSVPQRSDLILYDEYIHASIRDGIQLSNAKAYKFKHNDIEHLILRHSELVSESHQHIYIVTESVFSMDGDSPDLKGFVEFCNQNDCFLITDEAHSVGVHGKNGIGLLQDLNLEKDVFARIITFGKALGSHGAAILCHEDLKSYLVNFARSFIYTTALTPHTLATISTAYNEMLMTSALEKLQQNIKFFNTEIKRLNLKQFFIQSTSSIQSCVLSGNETVKTIAEKLQVLNYNVKPILSPTVPKGEERLRFCLHSYNSEKEMTEVLTMLATFVL